MQLAQADLDFLMSKSNQDKTADGLQVMGHRLAQEVVHYLQVQLGLNDPPPKNGIEFGSD